MRATGLVALIVIGIDQLTKTWVLRSIGASERIEVLGPVSFIRRFNNGAAFSLGSGNGLTAWVATVMIVVVVVAIVRHLLSPKENSPVAADWRWWVALGLIVGGGLGNQLDRMFRSGGWNHGSVVDFVDVGFWPVFNVADSALSIGCVVVAILLLFDSPRRAATPSSSLNKSPLA